jgi:hypothetical protein
LMVTDPDDLARALMRSQANVGREPGARGAGNSTRRIRLLVEGAGGGAEVTRRLEDG